MNQPTDKELAALKEKFKGYPLFQLSDPTTGETFIVRGSNWDEFSQVGNVKPGRENRVPLNMVKAYVVWPEIDAVDLEYNKSGNWQPGRIVALAEQIQELLGYNKAFSVKKL
ncbi:MAG: hypothetical protein FJY67_10720 [Calditrichaeota bacterium]|nr:hypothetical protein [Calditrichota bacterium]